MDKFRFMTFYNQHGRAANDDTMLQYQSCQIAALGRKNRGQQFTEVKKQKAELESQLAQFQQNVVACDKLRRWLHEVSTGTEVSKCSNADGVQKRMAAYGYKSLNPYEN